MKYSGSCLCKTVTYSIEGKLEGFFLCHCKYCQKDTGSAHASNLFSASAKLFWIEGKANIQEYNLPETRHTKCFCKSCGSALPYAQQEGALIVIPAGSLDTEISIKPNAHIFMASKAVWDDGLEKVPKIEGLPS